MAHRSDPRSQFDTLMADIDRFRSDVGDLTATLQDLLAGGLASAQDDVETRAGRGRAALQRGGEEAGQAARRALREAESTVTGAPLASVLVAFGLGFVVAKAFGGNANRSRRAGLEKREAHSTAENETPAP